MDYGKDHYATVSWSGAPDGRRTVIGWMSNWKYAAEVPTMQFRSANTLPREVGLFRAPDGRIFASSTPSPELLKLRGRLAEKSGSIGIGGKGHTFELPKENDGVCEILLYLESKKGEDVALTLSNREGEKVTMIYDASAHTLSFDRRESGITDFSQDFPAVTVSPTFENDGKISLRIFIDRSSIELFGNEGKFVMTNLVFPKNPYTQLTVASKGGKTRLKDLKIYSIKVS